MMTKSEALKEIGESLARIAATLLVLGEEMEPEAEVKKEEPKAVPETGEKKEEPKAQEAEEKKEEPKTGTVEKKEEPKKKYTLEDVRKALSAKSGAGFTAEVRALLEKHGGSKLSAIDEAEYALIMEEVQTIGSAQ